MTKKIQATLLVSLCLIWGLNWVAIKISLESIPPFTSAALRFLLATFFLFFYIKAKKISLKIEPRVFRIIVISSFLMYPLDYGFVYWGEQYLSAGVTAIFFSTFAIFTAFFTNFVFKNEPFKWQKYLGLLIGLSGIVVIFYDQLVLTKFSTIVALGSIAIILSAVFASIATVIAKKYFQSLNPVALTFHQIAIGAFFLVIMAVATETFNPAQLTLRAGLAMLYMSILASAAAFVIYYRLLKNMSAISLSLTIYIIPIISVLGDFIIYGEVLSLRSVVGMAIIFSGIWISQFKWK